MFISSMNNWWILWWWWWRWWWQPIRDFDWLKCQSCTGCRLSLSDPVDPPQHWSVIQWNHQCTDQWSTWHPPAMPSTSVIHHQAWIKLHPCHSVHVFLSVFDTAICIYFCICICICICICVWMRICICICIFASVLVSVFADIAHWSGRSGWHCTPSK